MKSTSATRVPQGPTTAGHLARTTITLVVSYVMLRHNRSAAQARADANAASLAGTLTHRALAS